MPRTKLVRRSKNKSEFDQLLETYGNLCLQEPRVNTNYDIYKTVTNETEKVAVAAWLIKNLSYVYEEQIVKKAMNFLQEKARKEAEIRKQKQKEAEKRRKALQDPLNLFIRALKGRQVYPEELEDWANSTDLKTKTKVYKEFVNLMKKQGLPLKSQDVDFGLNWLSAKIRQRQQANAKRSLIDKIKNIII